MTIITPEGIRIAIPQAIEAQGGAAIDAYVAQQLAAQPQES